MQGWFYIGTGGHVPCPQIHLLLQRRSDVISEFPKCSKIRIFRGYAPNPAAAPETP